MKDPKKEVEKISAEVIKKIEGESLSKQKISCSKRKSENPNSNKTYLNIGNSKNNAKNMEIKIKEKSKPSKQDEISISQIKKHLLEEKITENNQNGKELEFLTLIKYAKKGDRVGFINTLER